MKKLVLLTAIALFSLSCKKTEVTPDPSADFTYRQSTAVSGMVYFTNSSTDSEFYKWDFGDNQSSDDLNPSHTYKSNGLYEVMLIAMANGKTNAVIYKKVNVTNVK